MSYILDALKKFEHERKHRIAVPELLNFDDADRGSNRHLIKYLFIASIVINIGLIGGWQISKHKVLNDVKSVNSSENKNKNISESNNAAPDHYNTVKEAMVPVSAKPMQVQAPVPEQKRVKNLLREKPVRRVADTSFAVAPSAGTEIRILHHDTAAEDNPNVRIWEDEKGNIHFSGTAGSR
jgi:hypothetical protein